MGRFNQMTKAGEAEESNHKGMLHSTSTFSDYLTIRGSGQRFAADTRLNSTSTRRRDGGRIHVSRGSSKRRRRRRRGDPQRTTIIMSRRVACYSGRC